MSNDPAFTLGEEVRHGSLKDTPMSVIKISEDGKEITCRWFDKEQNPRTATFLREELLKKPTGPGFRISAIGGNRV